MPLSGNVRFMRAFIWLFYVLSAVHAPAHSDPRGEKSPVVISDAKGHFRVFFNYTDENYRSPMSLLLAEDGRELIPRHRLSDTALKAFGIQESPDGADFGYNFPFPPPRADLIPRSASDGRYRLLLAENHRAMDAWSRAEPRQGWFLPFPLSEGEMPGDFTVTPAHVAVIIGVYSTTPSLTMDLIFRCGPRTGKAPVVQVRLSRVGSIYDSVTASPPVWAGGRFWTAWVRQLGTDKAPAWNTVLTGLDPVTGIAESHDLPGISNWNTGVALAVNANLTLCAAWSPSVDGSYPGRARVVTAVFPLKPAVPAWR